MEQNKKPLANPSVICREVLDGEAVLVNMDNAASIALNYTGYVVWQLVDGRHTIEQIIAGVRKQFPDAPGRLCNDVIALLEELAADGFIGFELKIR
jgi:hypothetical protein